jgi:hypothetical protein
MTPKARKAPMRMMALTTPGMRSQFDSQEPADELMQPESGRVELVSRGRTIAFAMDAIGSNSTNDFERNPMPYCWRMIMRKRSRLEERIADNARIYT